MTVPPKVPLAIASKISRMSSSIVLLPRAAMRACYLWPRPVPRPTPRYSWHRRASLPRWCRACRVMHGNVCIGSRSEFVTRRPQHRHSTGSTGSTGSTARRAHSAASTSTISSSDVLTIIDRTDSCRACRYPVLFALHCSPAAIRYDYGPAMH